MSAVLVHFAPHPDDEVIGAPATLMAFKDAGWKIVNIACGLGRDEDRERREAELRESCRRAGFTLVIPRGLPGIGGDDDLNAAQSILRDMFVTMLDSYDTHLLAAPSPQDGHHAHEVVGRAVRDAVERRRVPARVLFWGLWADLPLPNMLVGFRAQRLQTIQDALQAHAGELNRNPYDQLVENRARMNAVLGPERVFGFGAKASNHELAEMITDVAYDGARNWRLMTPREFAPGSPLDGKPEADVSWWLHAPSPRARLLLERERRASAAQRCEGC